MDDINDLLEDTSQQFALVFQIYKECEASGQENRRLRPRVKNILENQRSTLDYLACLIHEAHGKETEAKIYYPFSRGEDYFERDIDKRMPGVRKNRPDIAEAIQRHQPYNQEWMSWLDDLRNEAGHRKLNKQVSAEQTKTTLHFPDGGEAYVQGVKFQDAQGNEMSPSQAIGGPTTDTTVTVWHFAQPDLPVPNVLAQIHEGLKQLLGDVAPTAGLVAGEDL